MNCIFQTSKVSSRSGFEGCMYDVKFNGGDVEIWQESINAGNTPQCCRTPTPTPPTLGAGVSFDGFGQLVLNAGLLNITDVPLTITFKFRTFNPNAYLFLVARDSVPVMFGIYLSNGYIVLEIGTVGAPQNRIQTTNKFNTGDWFQVRLGLLNKFKDVFLTLLSVIYSIDVHQCILLLCNH